MTTLREAAQQALEALETLVPTKGPSIYNSARDALRAALAEPVQTQQEKMMPITDDNGQALRPQYQVIERQGNWFLLYDQRQLGNSVRHEFRIQKLQHDIMLCPGITLAEAQRRFQEKVESDYE